MKYDDLEKTQDLFDIVEDVPSPIETIEMEGASKNNLTGEVPLHIPAEEKETPKTKKEKKPKKSFKEKWQGLSKKKKVAIIIGLCLLLIAITTAILVLVLNSNGDSKKKGESKKPEAPKVIIETDNYVYKDGVLSFINEDKDELGTYECENKDESLCYIAYYSDEDNFDVAKDVYEDNSTIKKRSPIYNGNYAFIYDSEKETGGKINLYNISESKTEDTYDLIKGFKNSNYVILKKGSKYGAIEFSGDAFTTKIDFNLDYLGMLNKDSKLVAKTTNKYFIYNREGRAESKGLTGEIKSYTNNYLAVYDGGYDIYDYKGNKITDDSSDFAYLLDDYVALVQEGKLFIKDYKNNKYNEDGIKLDSKEYNPLNIYNEDKKLIETKQAFNLTLDQSNLSIEYKNKNSDKTTTIDLNEGLMSANITYLNYFNGNLYFYKDEEKKEFLGKYSCSYKNAVDKNSKNLSNCFVARESFFSKNEVEEDKSEELGVLPIFNDRYVFIMDAIDMNNPSITLYDLKNNKPLSKYAHVDASTYTKEEGITFVDIEDLYIIAENKSNKFGVIKMGSEVKSAIGFNYSSIEKLKNYYMAKENAGTYVLLDNKGKAVTNKYAYKIIDYKGEYLKIQNEKDNKYGVININDDNNKVAELSYLDITLADDYYVVVDVNHKLNIHKYNDTTFSLKTLIDLDETNYKTDYEVTKTLTGYDIKIKSSNKSYKVDSYGYVDGETNLPGVLDPSN